MSSDHYRIAAEADLKSQANRQIWYYFIMLAILLFATVGGLIIMYRFALVNEKEEKVGAVVSPEAQEYKALNEAVLSGKKGIFPDTSHESIQAAMAEVLHDARN